jgi:transcriptional/translational regulatory protein YebC/TACO1
MDELAAVRDSLETRFGEAEKAELVWQPNIMSEVDEDQAATMMKLIDALEDDDDVQTVTTNMDASDEILEKLVSN